MGAQNWQVRVLRVDPGKQFNKHWDLQKKNATIGAVAMLTTAELCGVERPHCP